MERFAFEYGFSNLPFSVNASLVADNSKVSDHHAIIPTMEITKTNLSAPTLDERAVLFLISVRLLCAVGKPFRYAETAANLDCGGVSFSAKGRAVIDDGWKTVEKNVPGHAEK